MESLGENPKTRRIFVFPSFRERDCTIFSIPTQQTTENLAREVARHTTAVVNPGTVQKLQSSTLVRAKDEVLRIVEMLTEKIPNAVSDLLGEVRFV